MQLAHITDLHLRYHLPGDEQRAAWSDAQVRALRAGLAALAGENIELLAVTGDLVDVPHHASRAASDKIEADYRLIQELIEATHLPVVAVPGNHDAEAAMWQVVGKGPDVFDKGGFRFVRFCDHEHEGHVPHRLGQQRERFEHVLSDVTSPPQVHLQHFVIAPPITESDYPYNYGDADELARAIVESCRVRLCLSGHYHPGIEPLTHAGSSFITAPAASKPPHPWLLYDLNEHYPGCERRTLIE